MRVVFFIAHAWSMQRKKRYKAKEAKEKKRKDTRQKAKKKRYKAKEKKTQGKKQKGKKKAEASCSPYAKAGVSAKPSGFRIKCAH